MSNQTPLAPVSQPSDVTAYIVLNDFAPLGRAYVETDEAEADEATIVEIFSGLRVVAFNGADAWTTGGWLVNWISSGAYIASGQRRAGSDRACVLTKYRAATYSSLAIEHR